MTAVISTMGEMLTADEDKAVLAERFALCAKEFPDFDISTLPAIPEGFEDVSWHNDSCPSFLNEKLGLIIFVENTDPEKREFPEVTRFGLAVWDNGTDEYLIGTDDWNALQEVLVAKVAEKALEAEENELFRQTTAFSAGYKARFESRASNPTDVEEDLRPHYLEGYALANVEC